jgi:hypothetical protein
MLIVVAVDSSVQPLSVCAPQARGRSLRLSASLSVRVLTALYALVFGAAGASITSAFAAPGYDLGNAVRAIRNTAHGRLS